MKTGRMTAVFLGICFAAAGGEGIGKNLLLQYEEGLRSASYEEREGAKEKIGRLLREAREQGRGETLVELTRYLHDVRTHSRDAEVKSALDGLLAPYAGGAVLWSQKVDTARGRIERVELEGGKLRVWHFQGRAPLLDADAFDPRTGKPLGENVETRKYDKGERTWNDPAESGVSLKTLPGECRVFEKGEGVFVLGGVQEKGMLRGWLRGYASEEKKQLWEKKPGELPGRVWFAWIRGEKVVAAGPKEETVPGPLEDRVATDRWWIGCYDVNTGKTLWERKPGELPGGIQRALIEGERIYAAGWSLDGHWVAALRLNNTWDEPVPAGNRAE